MNNLITISSTKIIQLSIIESTYQENCKIGLFKLLHSDLL